MKTLAFISIVAAVAMAGHAEAKATWSQISMANFKARCVAGGGTLTGAGRKAFKCTASSGLFIVCIDTDGLGITCDWNQALGRKPSILAANGNGATDRIFGGGHQAGGGGGNGNSGGDADGGDGEGSAAE